MYKSDPPQCCYYISIFANIWYLIKLIHSITIILRVFMFYKQRVLANCWGRKDSAICASRKRSGHYFTIWHLCTSRTQLNVAIISLFLANIWYLIKLIHSTIIILRVFMFYKQRVLANFWGRKDSAICASRKRSGACYCAVHLCFINSASWQTFEVEKTVFLCDLCQSQAQRCMLLRCAYGMSDKQFVYADHAVFSTSKVG